MANIREYNSPISEIHPDQAGSEAYAQMGRHVRAVYSEVGQEIGRGVQQFGDAVQNDVEQSEQASMTNDYAQTFSQLTMNWNKTASQADPSKTDTADQWREHVLEPALDKLGADAMTPKAQELANKLRNELRMHFTEKTVADQSTMAGIGVQSNLTSAANALSQASYVDPTNYEDNIRIFRNVMDTQLASHPVSADDAAKVRSTYTDQVSKAIAVSAFKGFAERNPQQAVDDLDGGKFAKYFNGEEASTLRNYAVTQNRLAQEQQRTQEAETVRKNKEAVSQAASQLTGSVIQQDGSIKLTPTYFSDVAKLALMPNVEPGLVRSMIDMGTKVTQENARGAPAITDPHTYEDFRSRMAIPQGQPGALTNQQIFQARADGLLSDKDMAFYKNAVDTLAKDPQKQYAEKRFQDFLASMKPSFIPKQGAFSLTGGNPRDNQRWYQFQHDARDQFEQAYSKGDWQSALDPHNQQFLGHMATQRILNQKGAAVHDDDAWHATIGGKRYVGPVGDNKAWHDPKNWVGK